MIYNLYIILIQLIYGGLMEFDDVSTFLQIVNDGNIALAARNLYITQGTVSLRLKRLEEELGVTLLYRQKGIKKAELTSQGEQFLPIAKQWITLNQQALNIKDRQSVYELRISSNVSNNLYFLSYFFPYFSKMHPEIKLYLQTEHSYETHQLIQNQNIDLGFTNSLHNFSYVSSKPVWSEDMVIIVHEDDPFLKTRDLKDLNVNNEIHSTMPSFFQDWYHLHFPSEKPFVTIGDITLLDQYLLYPDTWTLVSENVADSLCMKYHRLVKVPFRKDEPPKRTTYMLRYKTERPWIDKTADIFISELISFAKEYPALHIIEL